MAKKYGGKIEGALNIPERERSVNNLKKDDKYFFNVDSESGNIEVFRRRPSGQITQQGETTITYDEVKVGDYDAKEGELSYVDGAANTEEKEFFSRSGVAKRYLTTPAKTVLAKGLLNDGKVNNIEEGEKEAKDTVEVPESLSFEEADQDRVNTNLSTFQEATQGITRKIYEVLKYPITLDTKTQDTIHFTLKEVTGVKYSGDIFGTDKPFDKQYNKLEGSVTLPIQSGISDSNLVKWGPNELDAINAALAGASLDLMNRDSVTDFFDRLGTMATGVQEKVFNSASDAFKPAILAGLAGQAVGIQGLLSRATGTVLNPNLELLFQGPQLRPFTFQFRLSPRGIEEAKDVKKIIRFFKQAMSVKKITAGNAFLKTPFVFNIAYQTTIGDELKDHPSLSKIKTCALLGCDVDYTPDGTYSTFNDPEKTMTSYNLTLRFNELEPITEDDYLGESNTSSGPLADADEAFIGDNGVPLDHIGF